jgi:hypothetical protein
MRRRSSVPLAGVLLLLSPLLTPPVGATGPSHCGPPSTHVQDLSSLSHGLSEASGLASSWLHAGVGWMIRDSGHPPSIYSLRIDKGRPVVREIRVLGADNTDWEDISYSRGPDGRGRLWIVESMQSHRDPYIYEVLEPDPDHATTAPLLARHRYQYPGKVGFQNTEASIWFDDHLILATKGSPTRLYRFATLDGPGTHWPAYVGDLHGEPRISMLRASPDHSALIASDHQSMAVYEGRGPGSHLEDFVGKGPAYGKVIFRGDNVEAGDFFPVGSCDVVMLAESRRVYRILGH